ncbi:hypothetical protein GCM10010342_23810 [Streptomyces anulatus]|nr:hypothetical protein GCM10010342_23810 [Streptomyces anulatus]
MVVPTRLAATMRPILPLGGWTELGEPMVESPRFIGRAVRDGGAGSGERGRERYERFRRVERYERVEPSPTVGGRGACGVSGRPSPRRRGARRR